MENNIEIKKLLNNINEQARVADEWSDKASDLIHKRKFTDDDINKDTMTLQGDAEIICTLVTTLEHTRKYTEYLVTYMKLLSETA